MDDARIPALPPGTGPRTHATSRRNLRRRLILHLPELALILVVAALTLAGSLQVAGGGSASPSGAGRVDDRVYTVDQVRTGLLQHPTDWVGRTVRVSGVLQGPFVFCGRTNPCPPPTLGLVDDGNGVLGADQYLPVEQDAASTASALRFNVTATYRLALHASSGACSLNPDVLCYTGTILSDDAQSR